MVVPGFIVQVRLSGTSKLADSVVSRSMTMVLFPGRAGTAQKKRKIAQAVFIIYQSVTYFDKLNTSRNWIVLAEIISTRHA
jgi:hypothetical protein